MNFLPPNVPGFIALPSKALAVSIMHKRYVVFPPFLVSTPDRLAETSFSGMFLQTLSCSTLPQLNFQSSLLRIDGVEEVLLLVKLHRSDQRYKHRNFSVVFFCLFSF